MCPCLDYLRTNVVQPGWSASNQLARVKTPVKFKTRSGSPFRVPTIVAHNWPISAIAVTNSKEELYNGFASSLDSGPDLSPRVCKLQVFKDQTLVDLQKYNNVPHSEILTY